MRQVCVYCASSPDVDALYLEDAKQLGRLLAEAKIKVLYGGGSTGLMGALADGVLEAGGEIVGIMPHFMEEREWGHKGVNELHYVADMHERKKRFLQDTDAVVALPGGCGTMEELLEVITWRRLGIFDKPIFIANTNGYYNHLLAMLDHAVEHRFMTVEHGLIWQVVPDGRSVMRSL